MALGEQRHGAGRDCPDLLGVVVSTGPRRAGPGPALASAAALYDVDLIVLGGGVADSAELLLDPAREALARHVRLGFLRGVRVVPASFGAAAGLVGAAALLDACSPDAARRRTSCWSGNGLGWRH